MDATDFAASASLAVTLSKASNVTMPTVDGTQVTLGNFSAVLSNSDGSREELALTDANSDGTFEATFTFVAPGDYTIDFEAPSGVTYTTDPARPATVTLASGQALTRAFVLTSASN